MGLDQELEQEWVKRQIEDSLRNPYFFKRGELIIAQEDLGNIYKRLKERIWTDRDGQAMLWWNRIVVYHSREEYIWMKILR